jgi:glycosyltransferase involved in cell wall biosynthesis
MRILQVSTADILGGAEKVAWNLFQDYRARGHSSYLAVGRQHADDPGVLHIGHHRCTRGWRRFWWGVHHRAQPAYGQSSGARLVCKLAHGLAEPGSLLDARRGSEDYRYPGTWRLLDVPPDRPQVLHCHNLHGKYFDLRALPWLSRQVPTVLTLHDAWLLSGHCGHSFDCDRWQTGCGHCPDLTVYPPIRRDASGHNWNRKRDIFAACRLYVATPCRWLMEKVERSMLAPAIVESRIIPNGIDLGVFKPEDKHASRQGLGLPRDAAILLFSGYGVRRNPWKDYQPMRSAVGRLTEQRPGRSLLFIALGEEGPTERIGHAVLEFVPFDADPRTVARYYQAADIYVHASRADTFPNSVLEALACGTPVVATAVGGVPEQVKSLDGGGVSDQAVRHGPDQATGMLVPPGDVSAMATTIELLLSDDALCLRLGENAAADARHRFNLQRQVDDYLNWYADLCVRSQPETNRLPQSAPCDRNHAAHNIGTLANM